MRLDAVISSGDLHWLASEDEKVAFFGLTMRSFPRERLPHTVASTPPSPRLHLFPDDLPIGVSSGGRVVVRRRRADV
jgi:hypothetical protein